MDPKCEKIFRFWFSTKERLLFAATAKGVPQSLVSLSLLYPFLILCRIQQTTQRWGKDANAARRKKNEIKCLILLLCGVWLLCFVYEFSLSRCCLHVPRCVCVVFCVFARYAFRQRPTDTRVRLVRVYGADSIAMSHLITKCAPQQCTECASARR